MTSQHTGTGSGSRRSPLGVTIAAIVIGVLGFLVRVLLAARHGDLLLVLLAILATGLLVVLVVLPYRLGVAFRRRELERVEGAAVVDVMTPWNTYATLCATPEGVVVYGGYRRLVVRRTIARADIAAVTAETRPAGLRVLQSLVLRTPRGGGSALVLLRWGRLWPRSVKPGPAAETADRVARALGLPTG